MSPLELLERVRRWLRSRQGRAILIGAVAGATFAGSALAQQPAASPSPAMTLQPGPAVLEPAPAASAAPAAAPTETAHDHAGHATGPAPEQTASAHPSGVPFPAAHPPAETAATAGHGATPHAPAGAPHGDHAATGHEGTGGHAVHHPEAFNFADIGRFQAEKEKAARGEKDAHGNPVVPVTPYAYLLVNAAILFFIYYRAGKKPITEGLKARHDTVAKELAEAARIKEEAESRAKEYADKLARLEEELERVKADIIKAGEADRERIVREAEEKADRMKRDAQFLIDQELKQLRVDMIAFTAEAAVAAAESVLRSKVTPADHDRLADEFLRDVQKPTSPGGAS